jgi:hypothetical protein
MMSKIPETLMTSAMILEELGGGPYLEEIATMERWAKTRR